MGPRPDGRGRPVSDADLHLPMALRQWGRGRMAAEGVGAAQPHVEAPASMGPRPDGRGRRRGPGGSRRGVWASMGPRPDGRGRACIELQPCYSYLRVNGAAAGWPRKVRGFDSLPTDSEMRQWGRGRMAAEGARRPPTRPESASVNGAAAGWPRKVMGADYSYMDPMRQWGRGRMAAEGGRGRRPVALEWTGVNGAAAGWPRKVVIGSIVCSQLSASMGPRPDGRGRIVPHRLYQRLGAASMGPRPDGRGRRPSARLHGVP